MKIKYLLTALLGVFGVCSFAFADTVGNLTSDSQIYSYSLEDYSNFSMEAMTDSGFPYSNFYVCVSSDDTPFYMVWDYYNGEAIVDYVNSSVYCSSSLHERGDYAFYFYDTYEDGYGTSKEINGNLYVSTSPITYNSNSGGSGNSPLLSGGVVSFSGLISGLSNVLLEFIPYLVYLGLGIIVSVIGFVAIRWLMNWTQAKIRGTFSSGKRRR